MDLQLLIYKDEDVYKLTFNLKGFAYKRNFYIL
jgi:hypothetical protein